MKPGSYRAVLAKEDFKFSAAHFTVFSAERAEPLHGHNYRVSVEVTGSQLDPLGFLVSFAVLKALVRGQCESLDERVLVPARNPYLLCREEDGAMLVELADRSYRFPAGEVRLLELENITVELLARYLFAQLAPQLADRVESLQVGVEETPGQTCHYTAPLR